MARGRRVQAASSAPRGARGWAAASGRGEASGYHREGGPEAAASRGAKRPRPRAAPDGLCTPKAKAGLQGPASRDARPEGLSAERLSRASGGPCVLSGPPATGWGRGRRNGEGEWERGRSRPRGAELPQVRVLRAGDSVLDSWPRTPTALKGSGPREATYDGRGGGQRAEKLLEASKAADRGQGKPTEARGATKTPGSNVTSQRKRDFQGGSLRPRA